MNGMGGTTGPGRAGTEVRSGVSRPAVGPLRRWAALLVLVGLVASASVSAAARTMQQQLDAACSADRDRLCPRDSADPDHLKACLLSKRAQVSDACMRLIDASE